ncbi:MAG: RND family efflux transporter MFP subunit [Acetothermia bacterium 64_32]|nr:MAG: RND family efflux transporter MFP subunit [Acetothermia bacterium 64_32]HAF71294.1 hypothetical protein [Candidatus Acetothermia bacterium]
MKRIRGFLARLKRRRWWLISGAAVLAGGLAAGLLLTRPAGEGNPTALGRTVEVVRGDISQTLTAYGVVAPKQEYTFVFAGDEVEEILVSEGDQVKEGDILVRLESTQAELALLQAERALKEAQAEGIPAVIKEKELAYQIAKENYEKTVLSAPFSGVVTEIDRPSAATENWSVTLIDTSELYVEVEVDQLDAPSLKVGLKGQATIEPLPDRTFPVEIVEIGGMAVERGTSTVVTVRGKLLETDPAILVGYTVELELVVAEAKDVLLVPISALMESPRGWIAMKVVDGEVVPQPVTIGVTSDLYAEVKSGLSEGDLVLASPTEATPSTQAGTEQRPLGGMFFGPGGAPPGP